MATSVTVRDSGHDWKWEFIVERLGLRPKADRLVFWKLYRSPLATASDDRAVRV